MKRATYAARRWATSDAALSRGDGTVKQRSGMLEAVDRPVGPAITRV